MPVITLIIDCETERWFCWKQGLLLRRRRFSVEGHTGTYLELDNELNSDSGKETSNIYIYL